MDIQKYLERQRKRVNETLQVWYSENEELPSSLLKGMQYSLDAGGKRIRPILTIAACEAVGGDIEIVLPAAAVLELIHTFSLVHDDLPAMDNDDLRRGKPTSHKVFGEGMAILVGDGLLAEAFYFLTRYSDRNKIASPVLLEVIGDIARATGPRGMVGGQVLDLEGEGKSLDEEALEKIHRFKTGRLITVSVTSGAKLGGANADQLESLKGFGDKIGLAFQIADDILNVEGTVEAVGKSVGSDRQNHKATYPAILGLENSRKKAVFLMEGAIRELAAFGPGGEALRGIARYIVGRKQ